MFNQKYFYKSSIFKSSFGLASAVIGLGLFGDNILISQAKEINYRYIEESELTKKEKK